MTSHIELPEKLFFKIGEVSTIIGVETHVLRYWEKEFPTIRPRKSRGGQRLFRRADVETFIKIKTLLKEKGFTVAGARKALGEQQKKQFGQDKDPAEQLKQEAEQLKEEIRNLRAECQALYQSRAIMSRKLSATQDALEFSRAEISKLLDSIDEIKSKAESDKE